MCTEEEINAKMTGEVLLRNNMGTKRRRFQWKKPNSLFEVKSRPCFPHLIPPPPKTLTDAKVHKFSSSHSLSQKLFKLLC
jgi:hypothetical protein